MATVRPSGAGDEAVGAGEVVNGGAIVMAGNKASDSPVTKDMGLNTLADDRGGVIGSIVVVNDGDTGATTDRAGVGKAVSGGTLAFNPNALDKRDDRSETWVMRGVTTKLSDVANTGLLGGNVGDGTYDNIHGTIADRKLGSDDDRAHDILAVPSTQIVPGRTKGTGAGTANTMVNPADGSAAVADEIFPSRSVPGELTYHFGGLGRPTNSKDGTDVNYKPKDSNE